MAWSIDPSLLAGVVVGGVGLTVALTHLTGGSQTATLRDPDHARERFALDYEGVGVREVFLSDDRRAALLVLADDGAGLLFSFGDAFVARRWSQRGPARVEHDPHGLRIVIGEPATPAVSVRLADPAAQRRWMRWLGA